MLFSVCLGMLAFWDAVAMESDDAVRAAVRSVTTGGGTASRTAPSTTKANTQNTSRINSANTTPRDRNTTESRATKNVAQRTNATVAPRTTINVANRTTNEATTRNTSTARRTTARTAARPSGTQRITGARSSRYAGPARTAARATTNVSGVAPINLGKCRDVYYECMDEFCATKDANLRRCACSARATEFDGMQKQFDQFEEKMLDFNERLLTVNMDAADVAAINTATEGEDAFYATTDKTKSKRALDDIAKKLNTTFGSDADGTGLSPITYSLNIDSAFDTVDSMMGAQTTAKSGVSLYNAAIPVCREIATEVCSDSEMDLAISGYQMQIEQDCNTVSKAYQAKVDTARSKVFESGALLDMSRLDAYQTRNSDDMLTCKAKMLDMLTDTTVCGANMEKCLDVTGKYIDPTTGAAFLTPNLADLGNMIARPMAGQTWTATNSGNAFLTYLKNKKKYLVTATANCVDIADSVWDAFIEDALAQIKLAQTAKLEEIRQACTTLGTECMTSASDSIGEFDARALSVFGVTADRTVNAMCADVNTACSNLMAGVGDTDAVWSTGMAGIATDKTYETILASCTQVGRNCIIESCRSISGNFGLCDDIDFSANRHSILERTACWPDVLNCVAAAGDDAILAIMESLGKNPTDNFYTELYGNQSPIYDNCARDHKCDEDSDKATCATCRIAEQIWGNCEALPTVTLGTSITGIHNKIHIPTKDQKTLLSWFAENTGTNKDNRSCVNTRCTTNNYFLGFNGQPVCLPEDIINSTNPRYITHDGVYCPISEPEQNHQMTVADGITNCCFGTGNAWGHTWMTNTCCEGMVNAGICLPTSSYRQLATQGNKQIICVGSGNDFTGGGNTSGDFPGGDQIRCDGTFIIIDGDQYNNIGDSGTNINYISGITGTNGTTYNVGTGYYDTGDNEHQNLIPSTTAPYFIHYE